ncbi:MAG: ATP-binding protein, partial [Bdellovibrionia bacterium]
MYQRTIKLPKSNSFFLFGARGTGKSTLLKERLSLRSELHIDLLNPEQEGRLQARPIALAELLDQEYQGKSTQEWV